MKRIFKNCRLIDGADGVIEEGWLLLEDSRISGFGPMEKIPVHVGNGVDAEVEIMTGKTILPGLIDCHVHLALDGSPDPMSKITTLADPMATIHMVKHGEATLRAGVTTVRDLGSKNFIDLQVRDAVAVPLGQGHEAYGRYAKGLGVNPLKILDATVDAKTGELAMFSTRVTVKKIGEADSMSIVRMGAGSGDSQAGRKLVVTVPVEQVKRSEGA